MMIKPITFVVAALGLVGAAGAQVSFTGSALSENFNTLTAAAAYYPFTANTQATVPGLPSWQGAKIAGTGGTNMNMNTDTGASNSGAMFNYGLAADPDRCLGVLASGTNIAGFGAEFVNNSGLTITEFTLSFDGEQYRSSTTTQNVLAFAWGVSGGTILASDFLTNAGMTADSNGNIVGQPPVTTNGVITPVTLGPYTVTITGLNVAAGGSIYVRWQDANDPGNDAGLGIDNLRFSAIPSPGSAVLLGLGGLIATRRRR